MGLSVALVNDYEVVVRGLVETLRPFRHEVEVVQLAANATVTTPVDIVLYDTFAQRATQQVSLAELVANPAIGDVAVYTWNFKRALIQASKVHGASGYLSKTLAAPDLVEALRKIHAGQRVVSPDPGPTPQRVGAWPGQKEGLTAREAEVLALITQGLENTEIADVTEVSINSIKSYIRSAYRKMGVSNRSNAILWAVQHGFRPDHVRVDR